MDMFELDTLDDFELDAWDDEDGYDGEDEWWQSVASGLASAAEGAYGRSGGSNWLKKRLGGQDSRGYGLADSAIRAGLGGLRIFFNSPNLKEDGDPYEPEYESDSIDEMEALLEDALAGDATDASLSSDEMVARSFGAMRGAPSIRPIMSALSQEVRKLVMMARRNPRLRNMARLAPLALRRTAVVLMKIIAARRPVNLQLAVRVFRGVLAQLSRSQRMRAIALRRARQRSRRAGGGLRRPTQRPSYGGHQGSRGRPAPAPYGYG